MTIRAKIAHVAVSYCWHEVELPDVCPYCYRAITPPGIGVPGVIASIAMNGYDRVWIDGDGDVRDVIELSDPDVILPYKYACSWCGYVLAEHRFSAIDTGKIAQGQEEPQQAV